MSNKQNATKWLGDVSESAFVYHMMKAGITVSRPMSENSKYDYIIEIDKKLYKVQCKTGSISKDGTAIESRLVATTYDYTKLQFQSKFYTTDDVDIFAIFCVKIEKLFLIPSSLLKKTEKGTTLKGSVVLRFTPPTNGHVEDIKNASDFNADKVLEELSSIGFVTVKGFDRSLCKTVKKISKDATKRAQSRNDMTKPSRSANKNAEATSKA